MENNFQKDNIILKINSNYILKNLFEHLTGLKKLQWIRFHKVIRNKLDIYQNNYEEYCATEIEIVPHAIPILKTKSTFINILSSPDKVHTRNKLLLYFGVNYVSRAQRLISLMTKTKNIFIYFSMIIKMKLKLIIWLICIMLKK